MVTGSPFQHSRQQANDGSTSRGAYQALCSLLMKAEPGTKKTLSADDVISHMMKERISEGDTAGDNTTGSPWDATNNHATRNSNVVATTATKDARPS